MWRTPSPPPARPAAGHTGIRLLPELEDAAEYARWAGGEGPAPVYGGRRGGWLRDIVPARRRGASTDGERLQWTTVLTTDYGGHVRGRNGR